MTFNTDQDAYKSLRNIVGENTRGLVAWVGAGASAEAGLPTWKQLCAHLIELLREKAQALEASDGTKLKKEADAIELEEDYWIAFERIKRSLGPTTFRDAIRAKVSPAATSPIPSVYDDLWRLRLSGLVTLNIDRLATRAFTSRRPGVAPQEFSGRDVARLSRAIGSTQPFIANLHGISDDFDTWVFTHEALRKLTENPGYSDVMRTLLLARTIIFVGVGIQDVAVSRHLQQLRALGLSGGTHFWLTNRQDTRTDAWAEDLGVRIIRYEIDGEDHSEVSEALRDLAGFTPREDESAPPVTIKDPCAQPIEELPPPEVLALRPAHEIRSLLNAHACGMLSDATEESYKSYAEFCQKYDEAIYRAWYISTEPGKNELLGYKLESDEARGAFGHVYYAVSPRGEPAAVKVLHEEVRNIPERLQSFRRGVRSMEILGKRRVEGMVGYEAASEIPAFVAMEWVQGPDLGEALERDIVRDWSDVLRISAALSDTIRRAHSLPERVLHRDIRPSNIMLKDYWLDPDAWEVVVLDFDLSWHRDAPEKSVYHSSANGYLAPEQLRSVTGASSRHSLVDSFGLGMTFYFLCSGRDPGPGEHMHPDWFTRVQEAAGAVSNPGWVSLPHRFARLIAGATLDEQVRRWDVGQMVGEIKRLDEAHHDPEAVRSAELICEELASRSESMRNYEWNADHLEAVYSAPTGLTMVLRADEAGAQVLLELNWRSTGVHDRVGVRKYVERNIASAEAILRRSPWRDVEASEAGDSLFLKSSFFIEGVRPLLDNVAHSLDAAVEPLRFEVP